VEGWKSGIGGFRLGGMSDEISSLKLRVDALERTLQKLDDDYAGALARLQEHRDTMLVLLPGLLRAEASSRRRRKKRGNRAPEGNQKPRKKGG
jgi:hypothetical protein